MDWRRVKFDWNRARAFLVTAEEGSLSAAARALGMTQPTLGRQVDGLEEELGVILFERAGRGLVLTPSGLELLDHVREMGEAAGRMSLAASGQAHQIEGKIAITASEMYSAYYLPPAIARLRREAPGIDIEIVASNDTKDLRRREADIAVRSFRPEQPELIARKIADDRGRLYGSRAYLESIGSPRSVAALANATVIGFDETALLIQGLGHYGFAFEMANMRVISSSHLVQLELVRAGIGLGVFPTRIAARDPDLVAVLPDLTQPLDIPIWLTTHREVHTSRRVRLVFDLLVEELGKLAG
ncbi:MAG: LysR family transcriptional regulator [Alphaproteobacteria bacterium]|nr:LysR family transcriptional regulator [Alphaproteobacteria bacterium]